MPQWRKLHVKTTESMSVNDMPDDFTRLLWVLLPLILDREGRGVYNLSWIRGHVMPLRGDVDNENIGRAMQYYASQGMVEIYSVDGREYFWIPTWKAYQGDGEREAPSHLPPPPVKKITRDKVKSRSRVGQDKVTPRIEEKRIEGEGDRADARTARTGEYAAIVMVKKITGKRSIPMTLYESLCDTLGSSPDEEKLKACWTAWVSRGYSEKNYAWALEWYKDGIPNGNKNGKGGVQSAPQHGAVVTKEGEIYV